MALDPRTSARRCSSATCSPKAAMRRARPTPTRPPSSTASMPSKALVGAGRAYSPWGDRTRASPCCDERCRWTADRLEAHRSLASTLRSLGRSADAGTKLSRGRADRRGRRGCMASPRRVDPRRRRGTGSHRGPRAGPRPFGPPTRTVLLLLATAEERIGKSSEQPRGPGARRSRQA